MNSSEHSTNGNEIHSWSNILTDFLLYFILFNKLGLYPNLITYPSINYLLFGYLPPSSNSSGDSLSLSDSPFPPRLRERKGATSYAKVQAAVAKIDDLKPMTEAEI